VPTHAHSVADSADTQFVRLSEAFGFTFRALYLCF
jgi:hypothetical protein